MPIVVIVLSFVVIVGLIFLTKKLLKWAARSDRQEQKREAVESKFEDINETNEVYNHVHDIDNDRLDEKRKVIKEKLQA